MVQRRLAQHGLVLLMPGGIGRAYLVCLAAAWPITLNPSPASARDLDPLLAEYRLPEAALLAADSNGSILVFDASTRAARVWDKNGKPIRSCQLVDERLAGDINLVALRDDLMLVSMFSPAAGKEEQRKLHVADLGRCRVLTSFSGSGVVHSAQGTRDGWLIVSHALGTKGFDYSLLGDDGRTLGTYEFPGALVDEAMRKGVTSPGSARASLAAAGNAVWLVPSITYGLWFPRQAGRNARELGVPPCLAAEGRELHGTEAEEELIRRFSHASEQTRAMVSEFVERSRSGTGPPMTGYVGAVSAVSSFGRRLGVVVRQPGRGDAGCRLDIWDTSLDAVIIVRPFPEKVCPAFLALSDDGYWVRDGDTLKRELLPAEEEPLADPCKVVARGGAVATGDTGAATVAVPDRRSFEQ